MTPPLLALIASLLAARARGASSSVGSECYASVPAPRCLVYSDRHVPKTGGTSIREMLSLLQMRGECVYWGFWQSPGPLSATLERLRSHVETSGTKDPVRLCLEVHSVNNYTGLEYQAKLPKRKRGPLLYRAMHEQLVELRAWGARTATCRVVLTIRTRDPLRFYVSYFMWRVFDERAARAAHGASSAQAQFERFASSAPDLQAHAMYYLVDGNTQMRIKRAGPIDAARLASILAFVDSFDLAWPLERMGAGLEALSQLTGLDFTRLGAEIGGARQPGVRGSSCNASDASTPAELDECQRAVRRAHTPCANAHDAAECRQLVGTHARADAQVHAHVVRTFERRWGAAVAQSRRWRAGPLAAPAPPDASAQNGTAAATDAAAAAARARAASSTRPAAGKKNATAAGLEPADDAAGWLPLGALGTHSRGGACAAAARDGGGAVVPRERVHCVRAEVYVPVHTAEAAERTAQRGGEEQGAAAERARKSQCGLLLEPRVNPCVPMARAVGALAIAGNAKVRGHHGMCPPYCYTWIPRRARGEDVGAALALAPRARAAWLRALSRGVNHSLHEIGMRGWPMQQLQLTALSCPWPELEAAKELMDHKPQWQLTMTPHPT